MFTPFWYISRAFVDEEPGAKHQFQNDEHEKQQRIGDYPHTKQQKQ
jgi:hypothetical protein